MPLFRFAITSETVFGGEDEVSARVKVVTEGGVSGEGVMRAPLFDTPRFARNLEGGYKQMWKLYLAGEKPRKIDVVDSGR